MLNVDIYGMRFEYFVPVIKDIEGKVQRKKKFHHSICLINYKLYVKRSYHKFFQRYMDEKKGFDEKFFHVCGPMPPFCIISILQSQYLNNVRLIF